MPASVLTLRERRRWHRMGRGKNVQVQVRLPEISNWLCPENLKKLNSPRSYVLQMRERNPGVQREASAAVARPAPVTLRSCIYKDLGRSPKYLHSPTQELSGDKKKLKCTCHLKQRRKQKMSAEGQNAPGTQERQITSSWKVSRGAPGKMQP